jgi:integrase
MSRLNRGTGTLYRPTYQASDGTIRQQAVWWMQYFVQGRSVRESTGTRNRTAATRLLAAKVGRVAEGRPVPPRVDKVTYDELAADLRRHYRTTGRRDLTEAEKRLRPLDAHFGGWLAAAITPAEITRYVEIRQAVRLANGTINRELSILGTLFRLGDEHEKVLRVPRIRLLKEAAPRAGFFEEAHYTAVRRWLRPDLQVACDLAYTYGWRMLDEVLTLEKAQLDLSAGTVRLEPGGSKNDDARVVYLTPEGTTALTAQLERVRGLERRLGQIVPFVFPHLTGPLAGNRIKNFRKAWATACRRAGCPGMLKHDFRRTAVRNLVNDGTPEKVAMTITGHKTRSVFDRYHIVAPADLRAAAERIAARSGENRQGNRQGGAFSEEMPVHK